jgi:hypothetical protein
MCGCDGIKDAQKFGELQQQIKICCDAVRN